MHIAKENKCHFVVCSDKSMKKVLVERDDDFWNSEMEKPLTRFYMDAMLREVVERRKLKHMSLKELEWVDAAIKQKEKNVDKSTQKRYKPSTRNEFQQITAIDTRSDAMNLTNENCAQNSNSVLEKTNQNLARNEAWIIVEDKQ